MTEAPTKPRAPASAPGGPGASVGKRKARGPLRRWLTRRHDPLTSLVLTIPVFLVYHLGILVMDIRNGVDLVSTLTFELLERSVLAYVGVTVGFAIGLAVAFYVLREKGKVKPTAFLPVIGESVLLAVAMLFTVGWATQQLVGAQIGPRALGPLEKLVMAAGAGFHEELVFRVLLFGGGALALERFAKWSPVRAGVAAALASSLVFSGIHYVGSLGDPFSIVSFTFRALAGLYLVAVFRWRGFAVAVYTHAIYDLIVFFLR